MRTEDLLKKTVFSVEFECSLKEAEDALDMFANTPLYDDSSIDSEPDGENYGHLTVTLVGDSTHTHIDGTWGYDGGNPPDDIYDDSYDEELELKRLIAAFPENTATGYCQTTYLAA